MSNRLTLTRALESSGMPNTAAERAASAIYDAVGDDVSTKADLRELEQRLEIRLAKIEHQFTRMVTRLGVLIVIRVGLLLIAIAGVIGGVLYYWK
jgi:hypothetical protein